MSIKLVLSKADADRIQHDRYHFPFPLVQKRLHAIYLKYKMGYSNEQVGLLVDAHRNSIMEWINTYNSKGVEGLYEVSYGTNRGALLEHATTIKEHFVTRPPHSVKEAKARIVAITGISRSETCVRNFLKKTVLVT